MIDGLSLKCHNKKICNIIKLWKEHGLDYLHNLCGIIIIDCIIFQFYILSFQELREHLFSAAHIGQLKMTHGISTHASQNPPSPQIVNPAEPVENGNASLFGKLLGGQSSSHSSSQAMANFTIFANIQRIMASRAGLNPLETATICEVNEENV